MKRRAGRRGNKQKGRERKREEAKGIEGRRLGVARLEERGGWYCEESEAEKGSRWNAGVF